MFKSPHRALRFATCVATGVMAMAGSASAAEPMTAAHAATDVAAAADTGWWQGSVALFGSLWDDARLRLADGTPDWLHRLSRRAPDGVLPDAHATYVVVQEDRSDGMGQVTVRYPLLNQGALRAYAGAGLNHTQYFIDGADDTAPSLLTRNTRRGVVDPAAELGAEFALSDRVHLEAEMRWIDLDQRADLLQSAYGPVAPDPVTFGLSLGYRFR
jgi:hypothetical protein